MHSACRFNLMISKVSNRLSDRDLLRMAETLNDYWRAFGADCDLFIDLLAAEHCLPRNAARRVAREYEPSGTAAALVSTLRSI